MIQHLVNVSGGKDSTCCYTLALESGRPFRAVMADTGNEHPATLEYVERLADRTGGPRVEIVRADFTQQLAQHRAYILAHWPGELAAGRPGEWAWKRERAGAVRPPRPTMPGATPGQVLPDDGGRWVWRGPVAPLPVYDAQRIAAEAAALHEPTGNPFLDLCIYKGRFPSRMAQFCTEELKTLPITTQVVGPMLRAGQVLQWLGIRAGESRNRAAQPRFNRHESGAYVWRPIFRWSVADVWAQHRKHGLPPNPLYSQGMGRVGCMPCVNCRKDELREIADRFPEHIERIERWEAIVSAANKRRLSTFFAATTDPTDSERAGYAGIRTVVEWSRTARGGRQFDLFFQAQGGGGCTSDLALCETDEAGP